MRILVCSLEAPLPPPNGLRVQVAALVGELRKAHEVRVLAYRMPGQKDPASESLRLIPNWRGGRKPYLRFLSWELALAARRPPGVTEAALELRPALREEVEGFRPDVVHVTSGRLARLGRHLRRPAVLAALDAWHLNVDAEAEAAGGARRVLLRVEAHLVKRFEALEYGRFRRVIVVSDADRQALLEVQPEMSVEVIPNGVDPDAFDWDGTERDRNLILFTGVMSYAPNVTAARFLAERILPLVREAVPEARLELVGRDPAPDVQALGRLPGVEVTGEVASMPPWLSSAGAYACPMLTGTGIKNKLMEAMANGLACVATPLAVQGIAAAAGREILVGSTAEELAEHLVGVLRDPSLADRLGAAGRDHVRAHHGWASVAAEYLRVYREAASTA